jgi:hypothetical protein
VHRALVTRGDEVLGWVESADLLTGELAVLPQSIWALCWASSTDST